MGHVQGAEGRLAHDYGASAPHPPAASACGPSGSDCVDDVRLLLCVQSGWGQGWVGFVTKREGSGKADTHLDPLRFKRILAR